jgi:large subunit ribosomal protein L30
MSEHHFVVRLKRSALHQKPAIRATVQALGLRRIGRSVAVRDTPANRGMLYKAVHLLEVERCEGPAPAGRRGKKQQAQEASDATA